MSAAAKGNDTTMGKERVKVDTKKDDKGPFKAPALDPSTPSPIFGGSTGGLLRKAQVRTAYSVVLAASSLGSCLISCRELQVEEFYVITWDAKKEQIFEMPTGVLLRGFDSDVT